MPIAIVLGGKFRGGMREIFLSSTARDLGGCCRELARELNALEGWHCVWMDDFAASDSTSVEYCQKRVQRCDVYIGVIGALYGSSPANSNISFTQHEYEAAVTKGMPRLVFVTTEDFPIPANLREPDIKSEAQLRFRERVCQERKVKFFDNQEELKMHAIASLFEFVKETGETHRPPSGGRNGEPLVQTSIDYATAPDKRTSSRHFSGRKLRTCQAYLRFTSSAVKSARTLMV